MGSGNVKPKGKTQNCESSSADTMPCHACSTQFSIFKRKHECMDCIKLFCSNCINKTIKDKKICRVCELVKQDMARPALMQLKIRELQQYLSVRHVSMESCKEKTDLVDLLIEYLIEKGLIPRPTPVQSSLIGAVEDRLSSSFNRESTSSNASNPVNQRDALNTNIPDSYRETHTSDEILESSTQQNEEEEEYLENLQSDFTNNETSQLTTTTPPSSTTESEEAKKERLERRRQQEMRDAHARFNIEETKSPTEDPRPKKKRASVGDINSIEDINELSVRALKEILATNFVDYRGCVEKHELLDRVKMLYKSKHKQAESASKEDGSNEDDENLCKICMDATIDCVLLECGHMVTCTKCGKVLAECPICRVYITRVVHTFKS